MEFIVIVLIMCPAPGCMVSQGLWHGNKAYSLDNCPTIGYA